VSTGLIALLDDVAGITKVAAASLDDVVGQAAKAGAKSAGLVIDDAAVTPRYVVGFAAARELPIILKITKGSLKNKLLYLLPAALVLSAVAPWVITPLLMMGALFLCYEGAEKVYEALFPHKAHAHTENIRSSGMDAKALEEQKVVSAIRTDFILSAEIMTIALSTVPDASLAMQAAVLAIVGVGITLAVYGAVGLIVKADDIGLVLAANSMDSLVGTLVRGFGRGLVNFMPRFLKILAIVGTAAMVWVGGGILIHALAGYGFPQNEHTIHSIAVAIGGAVPEHLSGAVEWICTATGAGLIGLAVGAIMIPLVETVVAPAWNSLKSLRRRSMSG
jgi:predicted DNA repair protein MutK